MKLLVCRMTLERMINQIGTLEKKKPFSEYTNLCRPCINFETEIKVNNKGTKDEFAEIVHYSVKSDHLKSIPKVKPIKGAKY